MTRPEIVIAFLLGIVAGCIIQTFLMKLVIRELMEDD